MTQETDSPSREKRRIRLWHVLLALAVLPIAAVLFLQWHWKSEFARRIAALAAAGYPVTPEELDASYAWPQSGENGADLVLAAVVWLEDSSREETKSLQRLVSHPDGGTSPGDALSEDDVALLAKHVAANAKAIEGLHLVTTTMESRYPIDLSQKLGKGFLPAIPSIRKGCLLLSLKAVLHTEQDDPERAVRAIEAAFAVAGTLRLEPTASSQAVYLGMMDFPIAATQRLLSRNALTDVQLTRLSDAVARAYEPGAALRGIRGLQCGFLELFTRPEFVDSTPFGQLPRSGVLNLYSSLGLAAREALLFLDLMSDCIVAAQGPTQQRCRRAQAIETRFHDVSLSGVLLKHVVVPVDLLKQEVGGLLRVRCCQVAIALECYRLERGRLPDALADLVPDLLDSVPEDPHDGADLRYRRLERGFTLYGVGEDGVDDGGREGPISEGPESDETCDVTFTVAR